MNSSARKRSPAGSPCPPPASTAPAWCSCQRRRTSAALRSGWSTRSSSARGKKCWAGARCRPIRGRSAGWPARASRASCKCLSARATAPRCAAMPGSASCTSSANRPRTRRNGAGWRVITPLRCRRGRFATRACCWRRRSSNTTRIWATPTSSPPLLSSTSVFRPTRFPPGNARSLSATWRTTARSIPCAATPIGCAPAKPRCKANTSARTPKRSSRSSTRTAPIQRRSTMRSNC